MKCIFVDASCRRGWPKVSILSFHFVLLKVDVMKLTLRNSVWAQCLQIGLSVVYLKTAWWACFVVLIHVWMLFNLMLLKFSFRSCLATDSASTGAGKLPWLTTTTTSKKLRKLKAILMLSPNPLLPVHNLQDMCRNVGIVVTLLVGYPTQMELISSWDFLQLSRFQLQLSLRNVS